MERFEIAIALGEDEVEDLERLRHLMAVESPELYEDYSLEEVARMVADNGFRDSLNQLIKMFEDLAGNDEEEGEPEEHEH